MVVPVSTVSIIGTLYHIYLNCQNYGADTHQIQRMTLAKNYKAPYQCFWTQLHCQSNIPWYR